MKGNNPMTAIEISRGFRRERVRYDFIGALQAGWHAFVERRRERHTIVALARLPRHVVRDMGLDPEQLYAALDGSWDEVDPASYRSHLPRRDRI
jgi:uncharacterized protein YjiS (DUF1127 family)